ncbi:HipA domain-containing protein [Psychromonas sp. MME2]|uniref:type II toxin-antitoxin system HipA family toxin n=1 Tax=unclassified Psychromonas TaxID=2614957 RepID=UPI00339BDD83
MKQDELTIQAFLDREWVDIAKLSFRNTNGVLFKGTQLEYDFDHTILNPNSDDHRAVSINHPVIMMEKYIDANGLLTFIDDIIPSGSSRDFLVRHLGILDHSIDAQHFILLSTSTNAPIGNLRIKESLLHNSGGDEESVGQHFTIEHVIDKSVDFLEYAQERGAACGGATGAGGAAPKLLVRLNDANQVWIDNLQLNNSTDIHYLVKFPRGKANIDSDILRAEYHFYHELHAMGFDTIPIADMRLEEGENVPSLWLPRFDIEMDSNGVAKRYGMESLYSMLKQRSGAYVDHNHAIDDVIRKIKGSDLLLQNPDFHFDASAFVAEWVKRDLLNIVFGNSDNHGRNTSFLRDENGIRFAPIYDFAPMKADPEGITRVTKWASPMEKGGEYDFGAITKSLEVYVEPAELMAELQNTAKDLLTLKARLAVRGVPLAILNHSNIGFDYIEDKLKRWGLL